MSDAAASATPDKTAIQRMMRRLDRVVRGLGSDEATTRQTVEMVLAEMPVRTDDERSVKARKRMIVATA